LLSTCNRTEAYLWLGREAPPLRQRIVDLLFARAGQTPEHSLYEMHASGALCHLLRLCCGLESMLLGETAIEAQVKEAERLAVAAQTCGPMLSRLLAAAHDAARRVRARTFLGKRAASHGAAIVELAISQLGNLAGAAAVLLGSGKVASATLHELAQAGLRELTIARRRSQVPTAGERRALPSGFRYARYEEALGHLPAADLLVAATSSSAPLLARDVLARLLVERRGRALVAIDVGVPRNIDPLAHGLPGLLLFDIDDVAEILSRRPGPYPAAELQRAERLLDEEAERCAQRLLALDAEPLVGRLHAAAEELRAGAVAAALDRFPASTHRDLDHLTRSLVRRLLHHPSQELRRDPSHRDAARALFHLDGS
jgi:glutamyl-tRNA reductase